MKVSNRYLHLTLWVAAALVTSCGPKQYDMGAGDLPSEVHLKTVCNQIDLGGLGHLQMETPYASSSFIHVRFSENPVPEEGDAVTFAKWREEDMDKNSYPASYRAAALLPNGAEIPLTADYFDSGELTYDVVEDFKNIMAAYGINTSGNFFPMIQFTVRELEEADWNGLSIFSSGQDYSGLLPPFELQYGAFKESASQILWGFHPLYGQGAKSQAELYELQNSYCSLFD